MEPISVQMMRTEMPYIRFKTTTMKRFFWTNDITVFFTSRPLTDVVAFLDELEADNLVETRPELFPRFLGHVENGLDPTLTYILLVNCSTSGGNLLSHLGQFDLVRDFACMDISFPRPPGTEFAYRFAYPQKISVCTLFQYGSFLNGNHLFLLIYSWQTEESPVFNARI